MKTLADMACGIGETDFNSAVFIRVESKTAAGLKAVSGLVIHDVVDDLACFGAPTCDELFELVGGRCL